jgi:hypothetical protein
MPLKYACFLSYKGISSDYYKAIVHQVYERLTDELKILMELEEPVFYDWTRFQPGTKNENNSIRALYESLCMVVLFVPRYFKNLHCALEYKAMESLEIYRLSYLSLSPNGSSQRLIFPVILRGSENLPEVIRQNPQSIYIDDLSSSRVEDSKLIKLAQQIANRYELFEDISLDIAASADQFSLPTKEEVKDLLEDSQSAKQLFPGYRY